MAFTIELLTPGRVAELWFEMEPLFAESCASNPVGATDITPADIYVLTQTDQAVIFAASDNGKVTTVLAIQFTSTNGKKGVEIIALAGRNLMKFKSMYWEPILGWLRANDAKFISAYGTPELAKVYTRKFGFDLSCTYVRMVL